MKNSLTPAIPAAQATPAALARKRKYKKGVPPLQECRQLRAKCQHNWRSQIRLTRQKQKRYGAPKRFCDDELDGILDLFSSLSLTDHESKDDLNQESKDDLNPNPGLVTEVTELTEVTESKYERSDPGAGGAGCQFSHLFSDDPNPVVVVTELPSFVRDASMGEPVMEHSTDFFGCTGCGDCADCVADQLLGLLLGPSMGDGGDLLPPLCLVRDASMGERYASMGERYASDFFGCIGCVGQVEECKFRRRVRGVNMYFPCGGCAKCDWDDTWSCYVKTKIVMYTGDAPTRHCCDKFKDMCRVEMIGKARSLHLATEDEFWCYGCHTLCPLERVFLGHVQAASDGGPFLPANIRPTCGTCERRNKAEYMWPGKFCIKCKNGSFCSCPKNWDRWPT